MTSTRPLPRPVLRLVAAIVAVCAALAAVAWSGLGNPRLGIDRFEVAAGGPMVYAWVELRNEGSFAVTVEDLTWEALVGLEPTSLTVAPAGADLADPEGSLAERVATTAPFEPFELAGGNERVVLLVGRVVCMPAGPVSWEVAPLEVTAAAPMGPARTTVLEGSSFNGAPPAAACEPGR